MMSAHRAMSRDRHRSRLLMAAAFCTCVGAGAAAVPTAATVAAPATATAAGKSDTVVTIGCLKAADETGEPAAKTHDASGAPYFLLTDTQLASASPSASASAPAPASSDAAKAAGIEPGAPYRIIGLSPRMLHARANTKVEITGKVEPGKAAAPGGATAIDSLPAINAKSIRTLSPRCGEDERK